MKMLIAMALAIVLLLGCTQEGAGGNGTASITKNTTAAGGFTGDFSSVPPKNASASTMSYTAPVQPAAPEFNFSNVTTPNGTLIVYYFYSSRCIACQAVQPVIDALEAKYPDVVWLKYDIATQTGREAYANYAAQLNLTPTEEMVPQVFVNGTLITDRFHINDTLEGVIENFTTR
jgi:thiol-disulfide isomerase/thioredoxin